MKLLRSPPIRKCFLILVVLIVAANYFEIDLLSEEQDLETDIRWSIVITARNDNYGDTFKRRLQAFINAIGYYDKKYKWKSELIICQWNPIEDKPPIEVVFLTSL